MGHMNIPMHPTILFSNALQKSIKNGIDIGDKKFLLWDKYQTVTAECAVTGFETQCIKRKEVFGKSFTNVDCLKCPNSDYVSLDAYYAIKYKWQRMSSWLCDGDQFLKLDRIGVRDMVFNFDMPRVWTAYATTSYKKHGVLNSFLNYGNKSKIWLFEMQRVDCSDTQKMIAWWDILNTALLNGISRTSMEKCDCQPHFITKIGLVKWLNFEKWAKDKYQSSLYRFLCYLLPSQAELKANAKKDTDNRDSRNS